MKQAEAIDRLSTLISAFDRGNIERTGDCARDLTQYADDCGYVVSHLEMLSIAQLLEAHRGEIEAQRRARIAEALEAEAPGLDAEAEEEAE